MALALAGTISSVLRLTAALPRPIKKFFGSLPPRHSESSSSSEVEEDLEKLGRTLRRIQAVLADAEEREISDETVRLWVREIRGLAHEAEDVLDELEFELLRHNTAQSEIQAGDGKAKRQVGGPLPPGPLENPLLRDQLVFRIRGIRRRSDEIEAARSNLRLGEEDGVRRAAAARPPPATARVDSSCAFGRDGDVDNVVDLLLSFDEEDGDETVSVVSVLGVDGVGKTTLAQLVFDDDRVGRHFEVRSWVWVSPEFDVIRLMREIVESVTGEGCDLDELSLLQEILSENVRGKRLLLVLDDVWNESQSYWEALHVAHLGCGAGSRVLITTTSAKVARVSGSAPPQQYRLEGLAEDASWSLFCHHAFSGHLPQGSPRVVAVGREICRRCRGFPITVRMIGELLRNEGDEKRWEEILASETWDLEEDGGRALTSLRMGYHRLPAHLKPCFAYCAVLARDCKFGKEQLVRMWVAQGLVQPTERKRADHIAGDYFDDLLRRSFFQDVSNYRDTRRRFMMHGLIQKLAESVWEGAGFHSSEGFVACKISRHHCHSTVICNTLEAFAPCEEAYDPKALRTLILKCGQKDQNIRASFLHDLLQMLQYVRVLDLSDNNIFELPDSFGHLKHLRYLGLNGTRIMRLPETVSTLYHLQTLELRHCYRLVELPRGTRHLISLRHLDIHCSVNLSMMPRGVGKLTSIQTLPMFVVGKEDGFPGDPESGRCAGIVELEELNDLRGELHIRGLQNVIYGKFDARRASMKEKQHLEKLHLDWSGEDAETSDLATERDQDVLESLQPHTNVRELKISFYKGHKLPNWMGSSSFTRLGKVTLMGCRWCEGLSPLGHLPALMSLDVHKMDGVCLVGREFFGDGEVSQPRPPLFPSLEALGLHDMANWEEWACWAEGRRAFPRLRRLTVRNCPKLTSLSLHNLRELRELEARGCKELACINCFASFSSAGPREEHLPCLEKVEFLECPRLRIQPGEELHSTLRRLHVCKCPSQRKRNHEES